MALLKPPSVKAYPLQVSSTQEIFRNDTVTTDTLCNETQKAATPPCLKFSTVRLPVLFSDIMAEEYAQNPFYSNVKPGADAWIEQYVV